MQLKSDCQSQVILAVKIIDTQHKTKIYDVYLEYISVFGEQSRR
jgi:hypothetical protein